MHVSVVKTTLQSIDQENQKALLSTYSQHVEWGLGPQEKNKVIYSEVEFEDIF